MANVTRPFAVTVHGKNPQDLIEKITRLKINDTVYWKEECFGLTAATLVDKAAEIDHIGGTFGASGTPCKFLCLVLKMLQIQPDKDIVLEFISNDDYKYIRALGAIYLRLTGNSVDIYNYLEPLYSDYRKLKERTTEGYKLVYMDEFIDILLTDTYYMGITFPYLDSRSFLEEKGILEPRESLLNEEFQMILEEEEDQRKEEKKNEQENQNTTTISNKENQLHIHSYSTESNRNNYNHSRNSDSEHYHRSHHHHHDNRHDYEDDSRDDSRRRRDGSRDHSRDGSRRRRDDSRRRRDRSRDDSRRRRNDSRDDSRRRDHSRSRRDH